MLKGKMLLAVIPARGGSKGIRLKNLHPLLGIPLVAYVGAIVKEAGYFDKAIVSTDHPWIAQIARVSGLRVPFCRPEVLSGDLIGDYEVLAHALTEMESLDKMQYDVVVMLQPTCPLRKVLHVTNTIMKLIDEGWDAVWTVSRTDLKYHPLKQLTLAENGAMGYYDPCGSKIIARQQLGPIYHRNGAAYAFTRKCLLGQKTIKGAKTGAVVIEETMISIDTLSDCELAEWVMKEEDP